MKTVIKLSFCFTMLLSASAYAQVTDVHNVAIPSVSTSVTLPNGSNTTLNLTTIDYKGTPSPSSYGQLAGHNLFHSFSSFNINSSEGVDFTNTSSTAINNVISRVTGGSASTIDGLLRSSIAGANFYFINPAGVMFGANAKLDVPAAFHVSTADSLKFASYEFKADGSNSVNSTLAIADPISFGFLGNTSATITVTGVNGLQFIASEGKSLDIVANNIDIQNTPKLAMPSGEIRLVAFKGAGNVSTQPDNLGHLPLPKLIPSATNSGNINIDNSKVGTDSLVGSVSNNGGVTNLWGGNIDIKNTSAVSARTRGQGTGAVTVTSGTLNILNGALITTTTTTDTKAGDINVIANNLNIDGQDKQSEGVFTGISSSANPIFALDATGNIIGITETKGNAGTVTVNSNTLNIQNGGAIRTNTFNTGDAGTVKVTTNTLNINRQGSSLATGITSETTDPNPSLSGHEGNAGIVDVTATDTLSLTNGAQISSSSASEGNAGKVTVTAGSLLLDGNSTSISSAAKTGSTGYTGNVNVTASKSIQLHNGSKITIQSDANVPSVSPSKSVITVSAPDIELKDSSITAASTVNDDAGDIVVNFSHWLTMDPSFITTEANTGNGGYITINGGELIYLQNSGFLTSVSGANSNGGNINVNAGTLIMETGVIQANAVGGSGGDINILLKALIPSQNSLIIGGPRVTWQPYQPGFNVIQAASQSGVNGSVNVSSPQFNISGSVSGLDTRALVLPDIAKNPCQSAGTRSSSLTRGSKGGIPVSEVKAGFIPSAGVLPNVEPDSKKNTSNMKVSAADSNKPQKDYPCVTTDSL